MFDALLSVAAALAALAYLGGFTESMPVTVTPALWSATLAAYAYRVYRTKRRISREQVGILLATLRQGA
ncbi:hypothetical protein CCP3SC15_190024 [Gammaproteobacteria bacterium]